MRCVSCFYTNAQFLGILFFDFLLRLFRVDSTPTNMDASLAEDLMNSFTLMAVGQMARNPEVVAKGDVACTRFCLIGNDYAGKDDEGIAREVTTSLWFVAFGVIGDSIAQHSRKGDQLIVEARVRSNNWTDKQGEKQYDHAFVVQGFKFGAPGKAKREERNGRREQTLSLPRTEDRGIGHERHAAPARDVTGGSRGGGHGEVCDEDRGNDLNGVGSDGAAGVSDSAADEAVPAGVCSTVDVADSPGMHSSPGGGDSVGASASVDASASVEARGPLDAGGSADSASSAASPKVPQEKPRGARSTRKAAASAAR